MTSPALTITPKLRRPQRPLVLIFVLAILLGISVNAQATRRGDCNTALQTVEAKQIDFGNFAPNGGGTVSVTTGGARTSTGPTLLGGTVSAGNIDVSVPLPDCHCYPLRIRVVTNNTDLTSGGNSMTMSNIVTNPTTADTVTLPPGAGAPLRIYVGADLAVAATQAAGTYNTTGTPYTIRLRLLRSPVSGNQCP